MQDEDEKDEVQAEPIVETVAPNEEPQPEQVSEVPVVEVIPEPVHEPIAPEPVAEPVPETETSPPTPELETVPEPEPTPLVASEAPPVVVTPPELPKPEPTPVGAPKPPETIPVEPPKPTPQPESPKEQGGIPQKVLDLTPAELDAARRLWITKNIHSLQKLSTKARHTRRLDLLNEVESFVHANAPVKLSKVAYELNISEPKASDYLRILVNSGRIKATGNTSNRIYK